MPIALYTVGLFEPAKAGIIRVDTQYEFKGTGIIINESTLQLKNKFTYTCPLCGDTKKITMPSVEIVKRIADIFPNFVNIYPLTIDIPQNPILSSQPIDFFYVLATDIGGGVGPLPNDFALTDSSLFGPGTGIEYKAEISPINDLGNLPTSSTNNLEIQWDLSQVSQSTGNFFLAKTTIPFCDACCKIPEPSTILSLLALGTLGAASTLKRKLKPSQSTEKETTKVS
jgi:hypothetical protein